MYGHYEPSPTVIHRTNSKTSAANNHTHRHPSPPALLSIHLHTTSQRSYTPSVSSNCVVRSSGDRTCSGLGACLARAAVRGGSDTGTCGFDALSRIVGLVGGALGLIVIRIDRIVPTHYTMQGEQRWLLASLEPRPRLPVASFGCSPPLFCDAFDTCFAVPSMSFHGRTFSGACRSSECLHTSSSIHGPGCNDRSLISVERMILQPS